MATTVFPKPSGWVSGSEDISFSIATTDWTQVTGGYEAEVTNARFTADSIEIVTYDSSIATYLTANIDKNRKDAANHKLIFFTASMPTGTISGNICSIISLSTSISSGEKGAANGVASLDGNGLVPANQLPSYVDDVQEYSSTSAFPATGEIGKIYVATDTNKSYRWSGSTYVELSSYALASDSAAGLMSATDKAKLDGIATGATNVVVSNSLSDTSTTNALSAAKGKELSDQIATKEVSLINVNSSISSNNINAYRSGNIVFVSGYFTTNANISNNAHLFGISGIKAKMVSIGNLLKSGSVSSAYDIYAVAYGNNSAVVNNAGTITPGNYDINLIFVV